MPAVSEGLLLSTRKGVEDRMVVAIFLSGGPGESPSLYEPRLVSTFGSELRFIGLERAEGAWVLQEWNCEILSLAST